VEIGVEQTPDKLVRVYIKIREARAELKSRFDEEDAGLKSQLDVVTSKLLEFCKENNTDGLKTPFGSVTRRVKSHYYTSDWDSFRTFCKERDALDLFERRIHQKAMEDYLNEHPDDLPVGLNISSEYTVLVRKSK
jgi:hypothetical protein